jgi:amino acid permease
MLLLLLIAALVRQSVVMLIECGIKNQKYNLEELSEYLLGPAGYYLALGSMFLFAYGGQTAYLIIVGDTIPLVLRLLLPSSAAILYNRQFIVAIFGIFVILPLCLLKDMSKLAWTSFLSIAADVILVLVVFVAVFNARDPQDKHFEGHDLSDVNASLFAGVGTMSFAFVCQHNSFLVFQTLQNPTVSEWKKVANISISFSYVVCLVLGLIGFFAFFPYVQGDLLNNFPVGSIEVFTARAFLGLSMIFTYPMESFVSRHCLLTILHRWHSSRQQQQEQQQGIEMTNKNSSSMVVDLQNDFDNEEEGVVVVQNFNPLQLTPADNEMKQSTVPSSSQAKTNPFSLKKPNKPKLDRLKKKSRSNYQLVNQNFFSLEDEDDHEGQPSKSVIDFTKEPENGMKASNEKIHLNEFSRTELTMATLILWGTSLVISLLFEKLGVVSALTGVLAAASLGYTLPGLIYIKTFYYDYLQLFHAIFLPENSMGEPHSHHHDGTDSTGSSNHHQRGYPTILFLNLSALRNFLLQFGLSLFMIFFGVTTLVIGITTIVLQQVYG